MTDAYSTAQYGATREHRRTYSAEALLKEHMDAASDPHDWEERNRIKNELIEFLSSDKGTDYLETALEGWFQNAYRRLLKDYPHKQGKPSARETRQEQAKAKQAEIESKIEKAIDLRADLKLLDLILPNGKALRYCTGAECKQLSGKTGAWLAKIAARLKPNQHVESVLSEAQVRKIYQKS